MTRAIAALLKIMADTDAPLRRRIEATEGLLAYEAPEEAVEEAKTFLTSVFEDADQLVDFRLDALELMRKAEARKITQPTVTAADDRASRELWRKTEIAGRRVTMACNGLWPPKSKAWADDLLNDDYRAPPGSLIPAASSLAESVKRAGNGRTARKANG